MTWTAHPNNGVATVPSVVLDEDDRVVAVVNAHRIDLEKTVRLIAHAPEMLDLLQSLLLREDIADDEIGEEIRGLLNRIKGDDDHRGKLP